MRPRACGFRAAEGFNAWDLISETKSGARTATFLSSRVQYLQTIIPPLWGQLRFALTGL
jgi:hypothetical protein